MGYTNQHIDIEVCLKPWVTLMPSIETGGHNLPNVGAKTGIKRILQALEASLTQHLRNLDRLKLEAPIDLQPIKIKTNEFNNKFNFTIGGKKEISCDEGACILFYALDDIDNQDMYGMEIMLRGSLSSVVVGNINKEIDKTSVTGTDYSSKISEILNRNHDFKDKTYLLVSSFLNQNSPSLNLKALNPNSPANLILSKTKFAKETFNSRNYNSQSKKYTSTDSIKFNFLFYVCPEEINKEIQKGDSLVQILDSLQFPQNVSDKDVHDIEVQFRHTSFEQDEPYDKSCCNKKILTDLDLEEDEEFEFIRYSKKYQTKLRSILHKLYIPVEMESISMRASDFVSITPLPSMDFIGTWEKLEINEKLKESIYSSIHASLTLSSLLGQINNHVGENFLVLDKLLLLHGPPGTGKSTLAKALFQKFSVKVLNSFKGETDGPPIILLELSADRIFSRYFGESPKRLSMAFTIIENILKNEMSKYNGAFIFMIIDEIETLATDRSRLMANNETADGVRLVNTLLTHLDKLKHYSNFFMIGTSNLIESLDTAFKDRACGLFQLPLPNEEAIFNIFEQRLGYLLEMNIICQSYSLSAPEFFQGSSTVLTDYSCQLLHQIASYCSVC